MSPAVPAHVTSACHKLCQRMSPAMLAHITSCASACHELCRRMSPAVPAHVTSCASTCHALCHKAHPVALYYHLHQDQESFGLVPRTRHSFCALTKSSLKRKSADKVYNAALHCWQA
eukprot:scaffold7080_cov22-Tisochrysis_lutea.AAC.2